MPESPPQANALHVTRFLAPYRGLLLGVVVLTVVLSILAMLPPLIMRAFLDHVIERGDRTLFVSLGVCMIVLPATIAFCGFIQSICLYRVGWRFLFDIRMALYDHMVSMSMRFFGKHSTGMLVNRLMGDTSNVGNMLGVQTISLISDLVCATFAITATFAINWRLAILLVIIVALFAINWRLNIGRLRRVGWNYWASFDRLSGGIQNRLSANLAVKTFGMEEREQGMYREQSDSTIDLSRSAGVAGNSFNMNTVLIQNVGRAILFFLGCAMVLSGEVTYGDVLAFTTYAMQLIWPAVRLSEFAKQMQDFRIAVERISEIMSEKPEIEDRPTAIPMPRLRGQVDFDHVSFHYEPGRPVIQDFDLHVRAGETIALIGPTGCGKSTVLSLLLRFFDVCDGTLRLDGMDVRDIQLRTLRRQFGIVLQEPLLFNVSIVDNIRYARPEASQEDVEAAARVAEINDFITSLPLGYRTILGSEGVQVSTGQKQRLTIARAVVAQPAILIMDEATSALDSESERAIQIAMQRVLKNRTAFIVAHRLSTIRNSDRIVVMRDGRITEIGKHDELMHLPNGHYASLYAKYMNKGFIEEEPLA